MGGEAVEQKINNKYTYVSETLVLDRNTKKAAWNVDFLSAYTGIMWKLSYFSVHFP